MSFQPLTNPIDYVLMAGRKSPGLAEVTAASAPQKWDIRKGYALAGARPVYRGRDVAKPVIKIRLLSDQDWTDWHAWKDIVSRPPDLVRPRAIDIWHPILEDLGIAAVVVADVSQPEQVGDGEWLITIKLIEYRRPNYALAVPDSAQARPVDPIDAQIQLNDAVIQNLNQQLASP